MAGPDADPAPGADPGDAPPVCSTCGTTVPADEAATARLTWSRGVENGREVWTCVPCARRHLRSIEGKLDQAWW